MKFVIADDHPLFREALSGALTPLFEGLEVLEAESTDVLIDLIDKNNVDLLLLDLSMPGANWFDTLSTVKEKFPSLPVVMVSANDDVDVISQSITLGAQGYIPKSTPTKTIAEAIDLVLSGEQWLPTEIAEKLTFNSGNMNDMLERFKELTPKQVQVLKYVRSGMMNKQIAHEMNVTEATVKAHISAALKKLDINTRTQAVLLMDKLQIN
ncbi:response regulator transcription factor [Alteromonas lipolytica]|uniref:DNA-binding response regulator n=1 Tax=Alteromonas lipolytica TaxID=1856405 RepID=A0A1E8FHA8_9ALTE|nr:response regulator transcription factor [Alteromonas lipolytica]OFI35294.1 DNA-binding response regulator [Alteromonas lipolytica]GGF58351.1 DNA-binding response regulator [Alteromonas lipolytica]